MFHLTRSAKTELRRAFLFLLCFSLFHTLNVSEWVKSKQNVPLLAPRYKACHSTARGGRHDTFTCGGQSADWSVLALSFVKNGKVLLGLRTGFAWCGHVGFAGRTLGIQ